MELFKNPNYDFLGWKWRFIIASLVLSVAGLTSIALKGGLRYGIDFKGGTLMTVKFAGKPPVDAIRAAVSKRISGSGEVTVQTFESGSNEVAIGTELADDRQLDQNLIAAQEARRVGGLRRRREGTVQAAYDFEGLATIPQIRRLLEVAVVDTLSLENSIARSRAFRSSRVRA